MQDYSDLVAHPTGTLESIAVRKQPPSVNAAPLTAVSIDDRSFAGSLERQHPAPRHQPGPIHVPTA